MTFELTPLTIVFLALAAIAVLGVAFVVPCFIIQMLWNAGSSMVDFVPEIALWQAALLYTAGVLLIYLSGLVKIEVRCER